MDMLGGKLYLYSYKKLIIGLILLFLAYLTLMYAIAVNPFTFKQIKREDGSFPFLVLEQTGIFGKVFILMILLMSGNINIASSFRKY